MADKNMEAQISVEFEEATSRQSLNSGETINTLWSKVKRWLSDLKAVAFSGSYIDLSDRPTTATTDTDGLMSAEDKGKLDGIAAGANNYSLPTATSSVLGGVKIGSNISISSGIISISKTNVTTALGYTPLSSISGVCTKGTTTSVDVTLGWKPSSVIIVDSNTPSSVYVPSAISSTGFSCGYLPEGTKRTYWAFK